MSAQRPIEEAFECAGAQPGIGGAALRAHILQRVRRSRERQPFRYANGELFLLLEIAESAKIFPRREILCRSHAVSRQFREDQFNSLLALRVGSIRNSLLDQLFRAFLENA